MFRFDGGDAARRLPTSVAGSFAPAHFWRTRIFSRFASAHAVHLKRREEEVVMKGRLFAGLVLAGSSLFAGPRIAVGFRFGAPVAPAYAAPAYVEPAYVPPCPGPDYVYIDGYWQHRRAVVEHRDRDFDRRGSFRRDFDRR